MAKTSRRVRAPQGREVVARYTVRRAELTHPLTAPGSTHAERGGAVAELFPGTTGSGS